MAHDERSLSVLVVDDEALLRWAIAEMLRRGAHAVIEAASAGDARTVLASTPIDVVVLDYLLPDSRDLQLIAEVRRHWPGTAVVLMTAFGTPELERRALAAGAYCVLNKPFDMLGVEAVIRKAWRAARARGR